ncbi:MAG: UDP-N-acetylmuramate dehydrogenase [Oscillospiraceae bacterium]
MDNIDKIISLAQELGCKVRLNEPLSCHSTFKTGGCCAAFIDICSDKALTSLANAAEKLGVRFLVVGNGSNLLFDDKGFDGVIFHIGNDLSEIKLIDDTTIRVGAGAQLSKLCLFALENSLTGLEFAYGIPGTVGGAVFMNAGAYGGEIKDVIVSAEAVCSGNLWHFDADDMELSYRHSVFQSREAYITSAVFKLAKGNKEDIKSKMNELMGRRKDKQPIEYPSAGSTFKRPEGYFAGKLIQDSGLRGTAVGGAQVSEKHCGFIINKGRASSSDIKSLIKKVQDKVYEDTGVTLECEVRIIPYSEEQ